jgi:hypothetical protein
LCCPKKKFWTKQKNITPPPFKLNGRSLMGRCLHGFVNWPQSFYNNFLFIWCLFVSWIWQCCLTSSLIFWLLLINLFVDIKKNSQDIGPNAPRLHFRYKQWPKSPCYIICHTRINPVYMKRISSDCCIWHEHRPVEG